MLFVCILLLFASTEEAKIYIYKKNQSSKRSILLRKPQNAKLTKIVQNKINNHFRLFSQVCLYTKLSEAAAAETTAELYEFVCVCVCLEYQFICNSL